MSHDNKPAAGSHDDKALPVRDQEDPSAYHTTLVAILGVIGLVVSVYILSALYYMVDAYIVDKELVTPENIALESYESAAEMRLHSRGEWSDADGVKHQHVPIAEAMEQVAKELK